ncbi:hypothetical protein ASG35_16230 [Burkholderia sp. Leaf177]|uniref:hypothetical protein n=1 Tax=Burkholderia sp. Leaf177 TaxID=1736287 RepID=UPI0006F392A9|nr:hypothetical protein [Burkholderia sp. Leaf177]KQR76582.1 hypothetical protein ASG35_16230 [Burkholderia sp. Leaf177]
MTTELTRYNGDRYVMRKGQRLNFSNDADKTRAGRAMLMDADMHIWESNAALVERVESFLRGEFSWYSQLDKSARDTLQTLLSYVRDGAVDIWQEGGATTNAFEHGGFTLDPPARQDRPDTPPFDYNALLEADRQSLREYNAIIDARIEREARSNPSPFETVNESEMPFLLSVVSMVARSANVGRQAAKTASGFNETADKANTPLGDALPFEYVKSATGNDVMSIAVRGVSEAHEAECHADYERDMDECTAYRSAMGGQRFMDTCSQRAFMIYQQCRGF